MMKKHFVKTIALLFIFILSATTFPLSGFAVQGEPIKLTIIHINDRHGRMGADRYISQLAKDTTGNVLILDAGDALHGQITANLTEGEAMVELMNEVGYSAMATGNHEYTYGVDRMLELAEQMDFPLLAANVKKDGKTVFQSYKVFDMDGLKVGVFGIATPETVAASDPRIMAGLVFEDPAQTAAAMVKALKAEGCDFIIALAHLGESQLSLPQNRSDALAIYGVDLVVDGHSHTKLENGRTVGDTLIAQTGEYAQNIGVVEIIIDGGVVTKTARLIEVSEELPADDGIAAKITELDKSVEAITSQVVGYTPVLLEGERAGVRTRDTNLANLITDSMRHASGADAAFINGGSIRASIPVGDITMGHVLATMPYSNLIVSMELSGAVIWEALEHGVSLYPEPEGIFLQVSGLYVTFDPDEAVGVRIKSVTLPDGSALDMDKTYTVAMLEFLAVGGDGYVMFEKGANLIYYGGDAEAFVAYLATNPVISAEVKGRVSAADSINETAIQSENETESPKTGDDSNIIFFVVIAVFATLEIVFIVMMRKRKNT